LALSGTYILSLILRKPASSLDQRSSGWDKWFEMEESEGSISKISEFKHDRNRCESGTVERSTPWNSEGSTGSGDERTGV